MNKLIFDNCIKYRFARHMVLFVITVLLFSTIIHQQGNYINFFSPFWITTVNSFFFFGYAYITLFLLIPEFLLKNKILWFLLLFLLVGTALSALKLIVSDEIFYASIAPENISGGGLKGLRFILVNTKDMTFIVALFCVAKFTKDYIYTEQQRMKLEIQNSEARQRLLQSQLNPHFLFNTINNLYALSLLQPAKTTEIIQRVQLVLRYIVEKSSQDFVNLDEELLLAENYILLEKLRYGNRLRVKISRTGYSANWEVPPMVLFFLAENCMKHGISPDTGVPWLNISVDAGTEKLVLSTVNSKPPETSKVSSGKLNGSGLQNLKKRLNILYPENGYKIQIRENEHIYEFELEIKRRRNEMGSKTYR